MRGSATPWPPARDHLILGIVGGNYPLIFRASDLAAAPVAAKHEAQVIAEVRLEAARPVTLARRLPLRRLDHIRSGQMVERHVLPVATRAAEAARAEHARHGGERGDVFLVVP